MVTVGVDLASRARRTAACRLRWAENRADVEALDANVDDDRLLERAADADKVGLDVPFGWPDAFVQAIAAHHRGEPWPEAFLLTLRFRETDRFVHAKTRHWPLSVSSDRIAVTAMRAAALLSRLAARGEPVDRTGRGKLVEVYPAAALRRWGLPASGYKGPGAGDLRRELLRQLEVQAGAWLTLSPEVRGQCEASDDALDALVAALVARAAARGLCEPVPAEVATMAEREGWIAIPKPGSLSELVGG